MSASFVSCGESSALKARFKQFDPALLGSLGILGFLRYLFEPFGYFTLFFLFYFLPMVRDKKTAQKEKGQRKRALKVVVKQFLIFLNPLLLVQAGIQVLGEFFSLFRHLYEALFQRDVLTTPNFCFALPFRGRWAVVNGGIDRETSHSWSILNQRYAYDFASPEDVELATQGIRKPLQEYTTFHRDILAPADGRVLHTLNCVRDYKKTLDTDLFTTSILGNFVMIRHRRGLVSVLAHLEKGSVVVKKGDVVRRGQIIGKCGNSGNSTQPHLHFHVQTSSFPYWGLSRPTLFEHVTVESDQGAKRLERSFLTRTQIVSNTPSS